MTFSDFLRDRKAVTTETPKPSDFAEFMKSKRGQGGSPTAEAPKPSAGSAFAAFVRSKREAQEAK